MELQKTQRGPHASIQKLDWWNDVRAPYLCAVMCQSYFCRVRVIQKFFESERVMTWSSRVRDKSQEVSSHFESLVCQLESISSHMKFHIFPMSIFAMKWRPTCYEMALDKLQNGVQCWFNTFDCRSFISTFLWKQFALW